MTTTTKTRDAETIRRWLEDNTSILHVYQHEDQISFEGYSCSFSYSARLKKWVSKDIGGGFYDFDDEECVVRSLRDNVVTLNQKMDFGAPY